MQNLLCTQRSVEVVIFRQTGLQPEFRTAYTNTPGSSGESETLSVEPLIPKAWEASKRGLLIEKHVTRLNGMQNDLSFTLVVIGIQGTIPSEPGGFTLLPNQMLAGLAKRQESCWLGDVVVAKFRRNKESGTIQYEDFRSADYCLIRNYFYHE
ncbi:hypothetical protein TRAPUB_14115 [Trametes pubescens]|uniref:Uncharacterized protein n=1 Tax=Trametes pubescens TaxID=154538 RepID=A0A1M2VPF5_TRAPU|nr:hypothetical protein TRAPUB_14115 [Trametes pubescens]